MTQRSPLNERYTTDKPKGTTRKSASSAKPKREAAATVTVVTKTKTKAEKKAERKKEEQKMRARDARYYNPGTPEYKRMRRLWVVFIVVALSCSILSFVLMNKVSTAVTTILLILAYAGIGIALYIDLVKIRRIRRDYALRQADTKAEKRVIAAEKVQREAEIAEREAKAAQQKAKKKNFLGHFKKKDNGEEAGETASEATGTSADANAGAKASTKAAAKAASKSAGTEDSKASGK